VKYAAKNSFFGKANCSGCHSAPFYTDNLMHDLEVERFYKPRIEAGLLMTAPGPIKTFPLREIKEAPPYLHDGRLLTLEDTVECFSLVLELNLNAQEKKDLVAFMKCYSQPAQRRGAEIVGSTSLAALPRFNSFRNAVRLHP